MQAAILRSASAARNGSLSCRGRRSTRAQGQDGGEHVGALPVVLLPLGEHHDDGAAVAVADGVELEIQPALGSADAAIKRTLLRRLAAMGCAFRWVV